MNNVNEHFVEFAACFAGDLNPGDQPDIAFPAKLDRRRLDYSLNSLKVVDQYFSHLHSHRPNEMGDDWVNSILWGGAYVGEVIRRNAKRTYDWVDFDDLIAAYPNYSQLIGEERSLGTTAVLTPGEGAFTLPINKTIRFIHDGPEDSLYFYAFCELR